MKKLSITLAVISIFTIAIFQLARPVNTADSEGVITIRVIDSNGDIIINNKHNYSEGMTVYDVLELNYDVGCANRLYEIDYSCEYTAFNNHIILEIDTVSSDWFGSYIQIFVNDQPSVYGIDSIKIENESVYTFKYVDLGGDDS